MTNEISVSLQDLQKAEKDWTEAGFKLFFAQGKVQYKVALDESKIGLFTEFHAIYKKVPTYAFDRLSEGMNACRTVSAALQAGREVYRAQEQENEDSFGGIK